MSDSEYETDDGMAVEEENDEGDSHDNDDEDSHDNDDETGESSSAVKKGPRQVYLPGHQMQEDESLVFDPSAYHMLHDIDSGILLRLI